MRPKRREPIWLSTSPHTRLGLMAEVKVFEPGVVWEFDRIPVGAKLVRRAGCDAEISESGVEP